MINSARLEQLAWDSAWLGFPVACFKGLIGEGDGAAEAALAQARAHNIRLVYLIMPAALPEMAGIRLADERLRYQAPTAAGQPFPRAQLSHVALVRTREMTPKLVQLAWQSGELSRFRRDTQIGQRAFEALYSEWLAQLLAHGTVWEARSGGQLVGFLALDGRINPARIELVAVAQAARRQGVAKQLVQQALAEADRQGHTMLEVVTQGNNHPARALYEQSGFDLVQIEYIYHCWL